LNGFGIGDGGFDLAGHPNAYGPPQMLLILPAVALVLYLLITVVSRNPAVFNYPVRATPQNRQRLQELALNMIAFLKAETVILFALIQYQTIDSARNLQSTLPQSLMLIGSYIGILAVTNMLLAAASTERRRVERAMAENESRFRAIVEDQTDLICRFTTDGNLTFVNEAYCRFQGKSRQELLGTSFLQNLPEADSMVALSYFSALPAEQPVVAFDHRTFTPDGRVVWHQYTVRRLIAEGTDTVEFQAVVFPPSSPRERAIGRM